MPRGVFISFEGPEGSGKSTQLGLFAERLRALGRDVVTTQEPGGTAIGMQIRQILLDAKNREMRPTTELLLMFASRAQNVDEWILPALNAGNIVLSDRFTDSTLVYQGSGRGLGSEVVYELDRIACRGLIPDLTLVIDVDTETGLARATQTRMENQSIAFHRTVREAYRQLASDEPGRVHLVDGNRTREAVAEEVWSLAAPLLNRQS